MHVIILCFTGKRDTFSTDAEAFVNKNVIVDGDQTFLNARSQRGVYMLWQTQNKGEAL